MEERRQDYPHLIEEMHAIRESQIRMETVLTAATLRLQEHHGILCGNGKTGLLTDVDRLKQQAQLHGWWGSAIAALGLKTLWDLITQARTP